MAKGEPVVVNAGRIRVDDLLDDLVNDYKINEQVVEAVEPNVARLRNWFGRRRAMEVTTADIRRYITRHRRTQENPKG